MTRASARTVRTDYRGRKPRPRFCTACGGRKHRAVTAHNGIDNSAMTLYAYECQACFVLTWI